MKLEINLPELIFCLGRVHINLLPVKGQGNGCFDLLYVISIYSLYKPVDQVKIIFEYRKRIANNF